MRVFLPWLVASLLAAAAIASLCPSWVMAGKQKDELKLTLEGKWSVVRAEKDGKPLPEKVLRTCFVTFRGEWMTFIGWDGELIHEEAKFHLVKADQNQIDVFDLVARKSSPGIYALADKQLTLCIAVGAGAERPQDLKGGPGRSLLILERFEP